VPIISYHYIFKLTLMTGCGSAESQFGMLGLALYLVRYYHIILTFIKLIKFLFLNVRQIWKIYQLVFDKVIPGNFSSSRSDYISKFQKATYKCNNCPILFMSCIFQVLYCPCPVLSMSCFTNAWHVLSMSYIALYCPCPVLSMYFFVYVLYCTIMSYDILIYWWN